MTEVGGDGFREAAELCIGLVTSDFGQHLDETLDSLSVLDDVCAALTAQGPLEGERLDLWTKLVGSYMGVVLIRSYGGSWVADERARGAYGVRVLGITAFPFGTASAVLTGDEGKSLASVGRALPFIAQQRRPGDAQA